MKEKGGESTPLKGGVSRRNTAMADHWSFLDEIEAPMWADLTLETQLMAQDIDDAWFRISHPIHQTSSRKLKSSLTEGNPKSPRLPDSVSRSRGKDFKKMKWPGGEPLLANKLHPIRKLGGKSLAGRITTSSSTSTVTTEPSLRKPLRRSVNPKCNHISKSGSSMETTSLGTVTSKPTSLKPNQCLKGPERTSDAKQATCKVSKTSNLRVTESTKYVEKGESKNTSYLQDRRSWSSKSSVGSSYSLGHKLDGFNSTAKTKAESSTGSSKASRSVNSLRTSERQILDGKSNFKHQKKATNVKLVSRESVLKGLGSTQPRKPLGLHNESRPVNAKVVIQPKHGAASGKLNPTAINNKENTNDKKIQRLKAIKPRVSHSTCRNASSSFKGKSNEANKVINVATSMENGIPCFT